jgi:hypothetical protein
VGRGLAVSAASLAIVTAAATGATEGIEAVGSNPGQRFLIDPPRVAARLFYHGETVRVSGTIPAGLEVAIVITGDDTPVELKLKGKVGGLIWSNVGDVTIDNAPSLYLLATSPGLRELHAANAVKGTSVGYRDLESRCSFSPVRSTDENRRIFEEFVKLKEKEELYGVAEGAVRLAAGSSGEFDYSAEFFIPADVPEGRFDVHVFAFDRYRETVLSSGVLMVEKAGLAGTISSMARNRGLLYGVLSVIVALVAGLLAGIVFGHRSKGGH